MFSWCNNIEAPIIVGHRGASAIAPENTFSSFRRAFADNANAVELDVQLTKDREVVVFHDKILNRTTDGSGLLRECTLARLRRFSAGGWFSEEYAGERVPLLAEALDLCRGKGGVNIELKVYRGGGEAADLVDRCHHIIRDLRAEKFVLISSFYFPAVEYSLKCYPTVPIGLLVHPVKYAGRPPIKHATKIGAAYLIFNGTGLRKRDVRQSHEAGLSVMEYTVNTQQRLTRSLHFSVDGIITDKPELIQP